jgi:hypothetical protein
VEDLAQSYEKPADVLRWYLSASRQRLAEVEAVVIENNVSSHVLSQAQVTDKALAFRRSHDGLTVLCVGGVPSSGVPLHEQKGALASAPCHIRGVSELLPGSTGGHIIAGNAESSRETRWFSRRRLFPDRRH